MNEIIREHVDYAMRSRRSVRKFSNRPLAKELLLDILDVARTAPSNSNMQPWHIHLVSGKCREKLSNAIIEAHQNSPERYQPEYPMYAPDLTEPYATRRQKFGSTFYGSLGIGIEDTAARATQSAKNFSFFGAPVAGFITVDRRLEVGSLFDCGLFAQNFMLAAKARGVDTCAQIFLTKYHAIVRDHLPISANEIIICGMSIGYAQEDATENQVRIERVPLDDIVSLTGLK